MGGGGTGGAAVVGGSTLGWVVDGDVSGGRSGSGVLGRTGSFGSFGSEDMGLSSSNFLSGRDVVVVDGRVVVVVDGWVVVVVPGGNVAGGIVPGGMDPGGTDPGGAVAGGAPEGGGPCFIVWRGIHQILKQSTKIPVLPRRPTGSPLSS